MLKAQMSTSRFHYDKYSATVKTRIELCKSIKQLFTSILFFTGGLSSLPYAFKHAQSLPHKQANSWNELFFNPTAIWLPSKVIYTVITSHLPFMSQPWRCNFYPSLFETSLSRIISDLSADRHAGSTVYFSIVLCDFTTTFYKYVLSLFFLSSLNFHRTICFWISFQPIGYSFLMFFTGFFSLVCSLQDISWLIPQFSVSARSVHRTWMTYPDWKYCYADDTKTFAYRSDLFGELQTDLSAH